MSEVTKKYTAAYIFFGFLSFMANIAPLIYYFILAMMNATVEQKVVLGGMVTAAALIVGINILFKCHFRSAIWIVLLGIFFVIQDILPLLIAIAILTIADEFIFTPLYKKFKELATINRQIDKRM